MAETKPLVVKDCGRVIRHIAHTWYQSGAYYECDGIHER